MNARRRPKGGGLRRPGASSDAADRKNRTLFRGDDLKLMRAMAAGSVDLTAAAPPFNKGRDFHAGIGW